jgi:hypothetical protein
MSYPGGASWREDKDCKLFFASSHAALHDHFQTQSTNSVMEIRDYH